MVQVRLAKPEDAAALATRLRVADREEIKAAVGEEPRVVLERSVSWSDPCCAVVNGEAAPIALFGAVPEANDPDLGIVWLLASDELIKHHFFVARNSRAWVAELHQRYRVLWNCVDARNEVHIRWLKWCGFKFLRLIEKYGVEQRPFYEFERVRDDSAPRV
ncbi:MAG: hypothetical protein M3430_02535 [Acidobacteriota bacterium]|nr:hypothetical protein [Acidobacteriota bacterium]